MKKANQAVQRTGASRFAQIEIRTSVAAGSVADLGGPFLALWRSASHDQTSHPSQTKSLHCLATPSLDLAGFSFTKAASGFYILEYAVEISSRQECRAPLARGATLSLEQEVTHITERFLTGVVVYWSGVIALCAGVLGVILCEFKPA